MAKRSTRRQSITSVREPIRIAGCGLGRVLVALGTLPYQKCFGALTVRFTPRHYCDTVSVLDVSHSVVRNGSIKDPYPAAFGTNSVSFCTTTTMQWHNLYDPFLTIPCGFASLDTSASGSPLPVPNGDLHDYAQYTHADFGMVDGVDGEMEGDEESDEAETGDNLRSHSGSADSTKPKGSKKCTETGPTMASTATPQQEFNGALNGAQPDWSPYGFTSFYPLPTMALVLGLGELLLSRQGRLLMCAFFRNDQWCQAARGSSELYEHPHAPDEHL